MHILVSNPIQDNPAVFGKEIDQKIRSRFKDLVPGNTGLNND